MNRRGIIIRKAVCLSILIFVAVALPAWCQDRHSIWPSEPFVTEGYIRGEDYGFTDYLHQASLCEAPDGNLLIACKGNRDPDIQGSDTSLNALTLWRSADQGKSWNIQPTPFPSNHMNNYTMGNLLRFDNLLVMTGVRSAESYDNGNTWGSRESRGTDWKWKPVLWFDAQADDSHPATGDHGFPPLEERPVCPSCRPVILPDGRMLFMAGVAWGDSLRGGVNTRNTVYFYRSDDQGCSLEYHGAIKRGALGEVMHEPAVIRLPGGRLIAFVRIDNHRTDPGGLPMGKRNLGGGRHMFLTFSDDDGRNWSEPWPCYIPTGRWNGSMPHALRVGGNVVLAVNASFHGGAWQGAYFHHTQRSPLVLMRFPLKELEQLDRGVWTPRWDAVRVIETSRSGKLAPHGKFKNRYEGGCPSTPHLIGMDNGNIGLLYDNHLGPGTPMIIKFKQFTPQWVADGTLDLWRGPEPLDVTDGFRVTSSQTEIRPVKSIFTGYPASISFTFRCGPEKLPDRFVRIFSVFGHGEMVGARGYSPFSELAAIGVHPGSPGRLLAATGGGARDDGEETELEDTGVAIRAGQDYLVQLTFLSRHRWALQVNGNDAGEFFTQHPGTPASFTLGYDPEKTCKIDLTFTGINWNSASRPDPFTGIHPWLAAGFFKGRDGNEFLHLAPEGQPQTTENGLRFQTGNDWLACESGVFAGRRMSFYGGVAGFVRIPAAGAVDLFSVQDDQTGRSLHLRAVEDRLVLVEGCRDRPDRELHTIGGLPRERWCFIGYASSALHRAGWLIVDDRFSDRLDATTVDGVAAPFFGQVIGRDSSPDTVRAGWHSGGTGSFELGPAWIFGRDCTPSTMLRLRDSIMDLKMPVTDGQARVF